MADDTYADLPAAAVGWLRADAAVVAAFGEDTSAQATTKLWADHAEGLPDLPYLVYEEIDEPVQERETSAGQAGELTANVVGHLEAHVYAATKVQARTLGNLVAASLRDAPLVFADGEVLVIWASGQWFEDDDEIGPGGAAVEYHRVVEFEYIACRSI